MPDELIVCANVQTLVDRALRDLTGRTIVSAEEVRDLLLDIRLAATPDPCAAGH